MIGDSGIKKITTGYVYTIGDITVNRVWKVVKDCFSLYYWGKKQCCDRSYQDVSMVIEFLRRVRFE